MVASAVVGRGSSMPPSRQIHLPALDGLRAVAAIVVFLWHYVAFPYGWAGVDAFFVLSGFLITGILYDSVDDEHRYRTFYIRRSVRIFPVYYAVLLVMYIYVLARHRHESWAMLIWPAYLGNYARVLFPQLDLQSFFNLNNGHFWTLCVEEQFYLLWPAVVYSLRSRVALLRICVVAIVILPIARFLVLRFYPQAIESDLVFRGTPFRCDALLTGAACALLLRGPERQVLLRFRRLITVSAGSVLLVSAVVVRFVMGTRTTEAQQPWMITWGLTFVDLFSAGLVLCCVDRESRTGKALSHPVLRRFGAMTYAFYVFHLIPITFFFRLGTELEKRHVPQVLSTVLVTGAAFLSTLLASSLSFRYFEAPLNALKNRWAPSRS